MTDVVNVMNKIYNIDKEKTVQGVEHIMGYNDKEEPMVLIIAEAGNPEHSKAQRKYQKAIEKTRKDSPRARQLWAKVVAEGILKSWRGILDEDGNEVEPTMENKVAALAGNERFFSEVLSVANEESYYRQETDEETEKN